MAPHATNFFTAGDKDEFAPVNSAAVNGSADSTTDGHHESSSSLPKRHPETGISVIIAGGGVGGLMAAMECWRKGHHVVKILERSESPIYTGDSLNIQPSAMSIFRHWPDISREIEAEQYDCWMSYKKHSGEHIYGPGPPSFNDPENMVGRVGPYVAFMQNRVRFYKSFLRQVGKIGLSIDYGKRVKDYFEDLEAGKGGVVLQTGEVYLADIVIAADGIKTESGKIVAGKDMYPKASGMAIYRCAYPIEYAMADPLVQKQWSLLEGGRPLWEFWMGAGLHSAVLISKDVASWALTHQDDGSARESWDQQVKPEEVLAVMDREAPGWHPAIPALMRTAPPGSIVHWKLMWRDLRRSWTSPGGRVVQVGDSAHSFLPSSGNGATQALEDAITLAATLQLAGRSNAALATKIYNCLRYERVSCAQKVSFVNAQLKHQTDWAAIEAEPARIRTRFPRWIYQHNPEEYAYEKFGQAFAHVVAGLPLTNTNYPPGHKFVPWTIEEVQQDVKAGKKVEDFLDGDWS